MGFYSPQSLVADARRHGLAVRGPDAQASRAQACVERTGPGERPYSKLLRGDRELGIRLGLASVRGIGAGKAERIERERAQRPFASLTDLARRCGLTPGQMESLATAGALAALEPERRRALWAAGAVGGPGQLPGTTPGLEAPTLPGMSDEELARADVWATGVSLGEYPTAHVRPQLDAAGVIPNAQVKDHPDGEWVKVAGVVTHRQRPNTAGGVTFLGLEDETGMLNIICTKDVWNRYRKTGRTAAALIVSGRLESRDGVVGIKAGHLHPLFLRVPTRSRDFH
jgi:error-prone DNA polymerase